MYEICALTGHRELPPSFSENVLFDALEEVIQAGCTCFRCGMARGFDLLALSCLVRLRQKYVFSIEACIPYTGHWRSFSAEERKQYRLLLSWCERRTVLFPAYTRGCFLARDRYMVEGADLLLAYCTKERGGAAYTVEYAKRAGIPVKYIGEE